MRGEPLSKRITSPRSGGTVTINQRAAAQLISHRHKSSKIPLRRCLEHLPVTDRLPANTLIGLIRLVVEYSHQINNQLTIAALALELLEFFRPVANNQYIRKLNDLIDAGAHQLRDMWYLFFDVIFVRTHETSKRNIAIVDVELNSLANESLDQYHHRRLAQIVRTGLEAESENTNFPALSVENHLDRSFDLKPVARQY